MTTQVQDEPTSLLTGKMITISGLMQREAALVEPGNASQKFAGKNEQNGPVERNSPRPVIRLPCPLRVGDPERYAKITRKCRAVTYKDLSKLK
jgi:hypothetical protein